MERFTDLAYVWGSVAFASAWQGTVAAIIAVGILSRWSRLSAATRSAIWWVVLLATVTIPAYVAWPIASSAPESTRPQRQTVIVIKDAVATGSSNALGVDLSTIPLVTRDRPPAARGVTVPSAIVQTLAVAWIVIAAALLVRLALSVATILSVKKRSSPAPARIAELFERLGGMSVAVRITEDFSVPVVVGYVRPMVLLPRQTLHQLDDVALSHVLLHELAHVHRGDPWTVLALRVVRAVMFPLPGIHIIARRVEIDQELACDEWALNRGGTRALDYVRSLLRVGEATINGGSGTRTLAPAAATQLRYRVESLLRDNVRRAPKHWRSRGTFIGAAITGAFVPLSAVAPSLAFVRLNEVQSRVPDSLAAPSLSAVPEAAMPATTTRASALRPEPAGRSKDTLNASLNSALNDTLNLTLNDTLNALIGQLRARDATTRARAAFSLSLHRGGAIGATPSLISLLGDEERVPRANGELSKAWSVNEDRDVTSPAEEAAKALLYVGRGALAPLMSERATLNTSGRQRAKWIIGLLQNFD